MQKMAVSAALEPGFEPGKCREIVNSLDGVFGSLLNFFTASNMQKTYRTTPLDPENGCSCTSEGQNRVREFQRNYKQYRHCVGRIYDVSHGISECITWEKSTTNAILIAANISFCSSAAHNQAKYIPRNSNDMFGCTLYSSWGILSCITCSKHA